MADRPRKRRWPWVLGALLGLAAAAAWWIDRQLEPTRLATMVLARLGEATGLQLGFDGLPEYALRPEPRLVLPGFDAREPGAATPMLRADRLEVSLPWDTIWGDGGLVITRLELQAPVFDLEAYTRWQATRAGGGDFELPTLTRGMRLENGRLLATDWTLEALSLDLPSLLPGAPARLAYSGRYQRPATALVFAGEAEVQTAGLDSDLRIKASGRWRDEARDLPWSLDLGGRLQASGARGELRIDALAWTSQSPLPDLTGSGRLAWTEPMDLQFQGELPRWPETWAALPAPIGDSTSPIAVSLAYAGARDLSDPLNLQLNRDETRLALELSPSSFMAWLDADSSSPLPPLQGELTTPRLLLEGVELEGVRLEIDESAPAGAEAATEQP